MCVFTKTAYNFEMLKLRQGHDRATLKSFQ